VRAVEGELQVPVALVDSLPRDSLLARLRFDPARRVVFQVPPGGVVGAPRATFEGDATRLVFPVDGPGEAWVTSRSRAHFRVHFAAFFVGSLTDSFAAPSLARTLRRLPSVVGTAFELELAPETAGFRLEREPADGRVTLVLAGRPAEGLETFAPEGPPGPRALRVVVIDPGHGGTDAGVTAGDASEKVLTLALARALEAELVRRLGVRVVLTRSDDRDLRPEQRAEIANRSRADLVLSIHFDGFAGSGARGATAWCPPALQASAAGGEGAGRGVVVRPWREVALRHAVVSRELAEAILSALDLGGHGPTRLREILPSPLLGVNAPGVMLECATLTSDADRDRLLAAGGLVELAARIADGVETYGRRE
jgi:N-acetylmuramoyl-L-alanine amidase